VVGILYNSWGEDTSSLSSLKWLQSSFEAANIRQMSFCTQCGASLGNATKFCGSCGEAVATDSSAPLAAQPFVAAQDSLPSEFDTEDERILLTWNARIRVLFNPSVWGGLLTAVGIPSVFLSILMFAISREVDSLFFGPAIFTGVMVMFVVIAAVIDLFGGFQVVFALTSNGVRSVSGKGAKAAATAAIWTGILFGKASVAGTGLLAKSEQDVYIPYKEVTKVKVRPGRRYILVKGGFLQKPIGLYCTPENFAQAESFIRQHCTRSRFV
jgi:hypothetical protein